MSTLPELAKILRECESEIIEAWVLLQAKAGDGRRASMREADVRAQAQEFIGLFLKVTESGSSGSVGSPAWAALRDFLTGISRQRSVAGYSPSETSRFVLSLKRPILDGARTRLSANPGLLLTLVVEAGEILDSLALHTAEAFQKVREEIILRQQREMLELSTPVVKLWDGVLALPMIGTLDSSRTQVVMESLLQRIVDTGSNVAIIDITGVPTVDTLVAQHLMKTVQAARLMGAECIISGIRPQIAQTIVHLGVELRNVVTKATLADAFAVALQLSGRRVVSMTGPGALQGAMVK